MLNRVELEKIISDDLKYICIRKPNIEALKQILLLERKMPKSMSGEILTGIKKSKELSDEELYWMSTALNTYIQTHGSNKALSIILDRYFSNKEHTQYRKSEVKNNVEKNIYPIIFKDIQQVNPDQWVGVLSADILIQLYNNQIISYNRNTQRSPIAKKYRDEIQYAININKSSVKQIKKLLSEGKFISNDISLNFNLDNDELEYDMREDFISLNRGQIDIIDGYHRFRAIVLQKLEDPDFEYNTIVNFMNFSEEKANTYIAQQDKRNKIDTQFVKSLDTNSPVHLVITRLNEDSGSYLYGCIGNLSMLVDKAYLFALIDSSFKIADRKEAMAVTKYLKAVFNDLVDNGILDLEEMDSRKLAIIIRAASYFNDVAESIALIQKAFTHLDEINIRRFERKRVNKSILEYLDECLLGL